jgi:hypothetical protein
MALRSGRRALALTRNFAKSERTLRVTMTLSERLLAQKAALDAIAKTPALVEAVLRQAMAETLLANYRKRYLAKLPAAVAMRRDKRGKSVQPGGPVSEEHFQTYLKALKHYQRAQDPDDFSTFRRAGRKRLSIANQTARARAVDAARVRLNAAHDAWLEALATKRKGASRVGDRTNDLGDAESRGPVGKGYFRALAHRILRETSDAAAIQNRGAYGAAAANTLNLGIGSIADLERIETPSAVYSRSKFNILWRHLEFGTGAYRTDKSVNAASPYRLPSGGWWFGKSKGQALHLRGSKPVGALRDPKTKLPYQADALRFRSVFAALMRDALSGPAK